MKNLGIGKVKHSQRHSRSTYIKSTQGIDETGKGKAMIYSVIAIDLKIRFLKLTHNHVDVIWEYIAIQRGCNQS